MRINFHVGNFQALKSSKIQRQGASFALRKIVQLQGQNLRSKIPVLWDNLYTNIINFDSSKNGNIIHLVESF